MATFVDWVAAQGGDFSSMHELDAYANAYLHKLWREDPTRSPAAAVSLRYGLVMVLPEIKHQGLPITDLAIQGWQRQRPGVSWPPMPWSAVQAVSAMLCEGGHFSAAVGVLLAFECYLRPSEVLALRRADVAFPDEGRVYIGGRGKMCQEAMVRLRHTKTGRDQSVTIRDQEVQQLLRVVIAETEEGEKLFPYRIAQYRKLFKSACQQLRLGDNGFVLHSLRHGGATMDYVTNRMSIEDIMVRGRWESNKTARRYIQRGRALLLDNNISDDVLHLAKIINEPSLADNLLGIRLDVSGASRKRVGTTMA